MTKRNKSAVVLSVFHAPSMTHTGRKAIAEWLRRQARMLVKDGKNYTKTRFTARYLYR